MSERLVDDAPANRVELLVGRTAMVEHATIFVRHASVRSIIRKAGRDLGGWGNIVSAQEIGRADKMASVAARSAFLAGRFLVRNCLAECRGCPVDEVPIQISDEGKPAAGAGFPTFSLSHDSEVVAVALSAETAVGIDIENPARAVDYEGVAASIFSSSEIELLAASADPRRAFFIIWTAKEATSKAAGCGFREDPRLIGLASGLPEMDGPYASPALDHTGATWWIRVVPLRDRICAVAAPKPDFSVVINRRASV